MNTILLPLAAIFISTLLMIVFFTKKNMPNKETKIYSKMLGVNFLYSILAVITFVVAKVFNNNFFVGYLQKIYMILMLLLILYIIIYNVAIIELKESKEKKINLFLYLIFIISSILIFVTPLNVINHGDILDGNGLSYEITLYVTILFFVFVVLSSIFIFFKKNNYFSKDIPFICLIILYLIGLVIRNYYPSVMFENFFFSFVLLIMYFTIENPDVKMINELEYAKNMSEKANRAKSDFLSSMSHEIRTPLNAIVGLSECIKNSDDIEEIHEDANDVVMASNNLLEIVNGILDISKIEADKMEIIETNYNPIELFEEITTIAKTRIGEKDIDLRCNFAEDIPDTLYGDKGKLKQIITNVLSNAVKYTEKGYIDFNVTCINEKDKCKLQIIVSDTGRGIKPEQIDTIFNKFERAEEDKNSTIEGTGLGLAITKSLVEMMGGKILVHSTYGEGSKFTVFIEQKYSKDEENIKVVRDDKISYSDKKVLVVDDNKLNIKVASKILSEFELNINSCDSGFSAIEKIENNEHYDIIFMDIMMPKMSGVETLKKLKGIKNFNTPVVALTADAMEGKSTKYIEVGFNDYLSKPINKDELKRVLDKCLNGTIEIEEEKTPEEDPHIHRVIPITDEDIEMLNRKVAEDLAKQQEQEEREKNNI